MRISKIMTKLSHLHYKMLKIFINRLNNCLSICSGFNEQICTSHIFFGTFLNLPFKLNFVVKKLIHKKLNVPRRYRPGDL
jgi:hypothetical protein